MYLSACAYSFYQTVALITDNQKIRKDIYRKMSSRLPFNTYVLKPINRLLLHNNLNIQRI